jgi:hypothetical protein
MGRHRADDRCDASTRALVADRGRRSRNSLPAAARCPPRLRLRGARRLALRGRRGRPGRAGRRRRGWSRCWSRCRGRLAGARRAARSRGRRRVRCCGGSSRSPGERIRRRRRRGRLGRGMRIRGRRGERVERQSAGRGREEQKRERPPQGGTGVDRRRTSPSRPHLPTATQPQKPSDLALHESPPTRCFRFT